MTIAQPFKVGWRYRKIRVPKGRLNPRTNQGSFDGHGFIPVPSGLGRLARALPTLKHWAIFNSPFGRGTCGQPRSAIRCRCAKGWTLGFPATTVVLCRRRQKQIVKLWAKSEYRLN